MRGMTLDLTDLPTFGSDPLGLRDIVKANNIIEFEVPFAHGDGFIHYFVIKTIVPSKDVEKIYGSKERDDHRNS